MDTVGLPFRVVSARHEGGVGYMQRARFTCSRCEQSHNLPLFRGSKAFNPEKTVKAAQAAGWDCHQNSETATCPACVAAKRQAARGDRIEKAPPALEAPVKPAPPLSVVPTPMTSDQRLKIRSALDSHFDDSKGRYLGGYSDHRIAEELKIPRIHVETIREAAYGPIRVSKEQEEAEAAIAAIEARVRAAEGAFKALQDGAQQQVDRLLANVRAEADQLAEQVVAAETAIAKLRKGVAA